MADERRLVVTLETRINKLERGMKRAAQASDSAMGHIERRAGQTSRKLENEFRRSTQQIQSQFATIGAGFGRIAAFTGVGAIGGLAGSQIIQSLQRTAQEVRNLAAEAERAGVSFEAFQRLAFLGQSENVSLAALTDGLKELQLRADEFVVTGKGPAAEAFQRLGFDAATLAERLKEPEALFLSIIERLRALPKAAQIRVADEVFGGTGGEQFVQLLDVSQQKIVETMSRASVLTEETNRRAKAVTDSFNALADVVTTRVNTALIDSAYHVTTMGEAVASWAESVGSFGESLQRELNAAGNHPFWKQVGEFIKIDGVSVLAPNPENLPEGARLLDETAREDAQRRIVAMERERASLAQRIAGHEEAAATAQAQRSGLSRQHMQAAETLRGQVDDLNERIDHLQKLLGQEGVGAEVAGLTREWQALLREAEGLEAAIDAAGNADGLPAIRDRLDEIAVSVLRLADRFRELGAAIPSDADLMAGNGPGGFYGAPGHIGPEGAGFTYGAGVGPRTAAATPRTRPDYSGGGPMLLQVARGFLGAREDRDADILSNLFKQAGHNIDPKMVAWCAAFVNAVLATQGLPGTGSLGARSFLDYGRETNDPKPGDLAVFSRGRDPNAGHVGFFVGFDENGDVRIVGGNQGGARMGGGGVTETTMPRDRLLGFRQVAGGGRGSPVDESLTQLGERNQLATEAHNEALARQSALEAEAAAMREQNATSLERYVQGLERASALLQQGAIDHETYNREVARLGDAYAQATEAADQLNTVTPDLESGLAGMQSLFGTVTGSLEQIAEGGESARKALIRLALQLAQMALFGGGPFGGGILGQLMGGISGGGGINIPGRATGGPVTAGMPYVVGERRPELFVPNVSGRILPRIPTLSGGSGGAAGGMRVVVNDMRTTASPPVAQQRRTGPDGRDELVLTIMDEVVRDMERGGRVAETMERRFGAVRRF